MSNAVPDTAFDPMDDAAEARAIAEARAQIAGGEGIPLADMVRWLDSWGTPDELPPPPWK
jgi:predicted transcriptional regulator